MLPSAPRLAAQIAATEQVIVSTRDQLQITEAQAQAGIVPHANVLSIKTQLCAFEASLPPLRQNLNQS